MNYQDFHDAGLKVFGLHGVTEDGFCQCGNPKCQALYKHPRTSAWQHTPHWSDEQMEVFEEDGELRHRVWGSTSWPYCC